MSYKTDSAKRRDFRSAKDTDDKKLRSKKNKKKFCRGKVGVEHSPVCTIYRDGLKTTDMAFNWRVLICSKCGKHLEFYFPFDNILVNKINKQETKPGWVTK